jgi:hypothetical protein
LKENNFGSKLNLDRCLEFLGFQASFLTCWFPFLPTLPQLLYPNKLAMVFYKACWGSTTFISFIPTPILVSLVAYWHVLHMTWPKHVPLNGATSYNGTQDTILMNAKVNVLRFMPSSLT